MDIYYEMVLLNGVPWTGKPVTLDQIIDYRQERTDNNWVFFYPDYTVYHHFLNSQFSYTWAHQNTPGNIKMIKAYYYKNITPDTSYGLLV